MFDVFLIIGVYLVFMLLFLKLLRIENQKTKKAIKAVFFLVLALCVVIFILLQFGNIELAEKIEVFCTGMVGFCVIGFMLEWGIEEDKRQRQQIQQQEQTVQTQDGVLEQVNTEQNKD